MCWAQTMHTASFRCIRFTTPSVTLTQPTRGRTGGRNIPMASDWKTTGPAEYMTSDLTGITYVIFKKPVGDLCPHNWAAVALGKGYKIDADDPEDAKAWAMQYDVETAIPGGA